MRYTIYIENGMLVSSEKWDRFNYKLHRCKSARSAYNTALYWARRLKTIMLVEHNSMKKNGKVPVWFIGPKGFMEGV